MKTPEPTTPAHTDAAEIARQIHELFAARDGYRPGESALAALIEPKLSERDERIAALTEERDALQSTITACEDEVAKVYWHITDSKFSKMNTRAEVIIDEYEEKLAAAREDGERLDRLVNILGLKVVHDEDSRWTCWLEVPVIPSRTESKNVREFIDLFKRFDAARLPHNEEGKG